MPIEGEYEPSPAQWVRDQVDEYERSGGQKANTLLDTGMPVIIVTARGNKSGKVRKFALMRVEHDGEYALVASKGGAPTNPVWVLQPQGRSDGRRHPGRPRTLRRRRPRGVRPGASPTGGQRAVAAFPPYAEYQTKTDRQIPVFVATRR